MTLNTPKSPNDRFSIDLPIHIEKVHTDECGCNTDNTERFER